jgi:hypothetical protein
VAKPATLIQDQGLVRNVDSKIRSFRFEYCPFLLGDCSLATFATKSALFGLGAMSDLSP